MADERTAKVETFEVWPHRSLSRGGAAAVLGVLAVGLAVVVVRSPGPAFVPVTFGAVASFCILALAFWASFRSARCVERVVIGPKVVRIERRHADRIAAVAEFSTYWVRVDVSRDRNIDNRLTLVESGRCTSIGEFLSPAERQHLADALRTGLAVVRHRTRLPDNGAAPSPMRFGS